MAIDWKKNSAARSAISKGDLPVQEIAQLIQTALTPVDGEDLPTHALQSMVNDAMGSESTAGLDALESLGLPIEDHLIDPSETGSRHLLASWAGAPALDWMIARGIDIHAPDPYGMTPLCQACMGRRHEQAVALLARGASPVAAPGFERKRLAEPLICALRNQSQRHKEFETAQALLLAGAVPNLPSEELSSLCSALRFEDARVFEILLESACRSPERQGLLDQALSHACALYVGNGPNGTYDTEAMLAAIRAMLDLGANPNATTLSYGCGLLYLPHLQSEGAPCQRECAHLDPACHDGALGQGRWAIECDGA